MEISTWLIGINSPKSFIKDLVVKITSIRVQLACATMKCERICGKVWVAEVFFMNVLILSLLEIYYISSFISRLKNDIKLMLEIPSN